MTQRVPKFCAALRFFNMVDRVSKKPAILRQGTDNLGDVSKSDYRDAVDWTGRVNESLG